MKQKYGFSGMLQRTAQVYQDHQIHAVTLDWIAEEIPAALIYNGISHAVMMITPQDLHLFAIGFSLSEGIIESRNEIYDIEIKEIEKGIEIYIELSSRRFSQFKQRRRSLTGRSGCGICGTEHLDEIYQPIPTLAMTQQFNISYIKESIENLKQSQSIRQRTGCTHAAGWINNDGILVGCCEDIGRHNALDKVLGLKTEQNWKAGAILVSSRASYEMVKKTASCKVEILFSLSAATSLAIDIAHECGLTLVSFCKGDSAVVYTHPQRLVV